jgi:hypothetical protein
MTLIQCKIKADDTILLKHALTGNQYELDIINITQPKPFQRAQEMPISGTSRELLEYMYILASQLACRISL